MRIKILAALLLGGLVLAGCATGGPDSLPTAAQAQESVTDAPMPYAGELACVSSLDEPFPWTVTVTSFVDRSGAYQPESQGRLLPQGIEYMAESALGAAGVQVVSRRGAVAGTVDWEQGKAEAGLLVQPTALANGQFEPYRRVVSGAHLFLEGSVTGYEPHISSAGAEGSVFGVGAGARRWVGEFETDAAFVDAGDLAHVVGDQRRVVVTGYETKAGIFSFSLGPLITLNAGSVQQDGTVLGIRAVVNRTVLNHIYKSWPPARKCMPEGLVLRGMLPETPKLASVALESAPPQVALEPPPTAPTPAARPAVRAAEPATPEATKPAPPRKPFGVRADELGFPVDPREECECPE